MPTAAVHSLLSLLSEVDFGAPAACGEAVGPSPGVQTDQDELAAFSMGPALKRQLVAARAERLARFLRRQSARSGSPLAANGYLPRCHAPFGLRIKALPDLLDSEFKCTGTAIPHSSAGLFSRRASR